MRDLSDKLKMVRRFTGDRFGTARGYDLRKPMSKARKRTINKYFEMIMELTSRPHKIITPPRGAKRETFMFTGQDHHPKFTKAIVVLPDPGSTYKFVIDKARPKGSRFILINRRTNERSWRIPADVFLDENEFLYDEDQDIDPTFFEAVLEEYGERGEVYMIEAGDFHMWGSAGHAKRVAEKLSDLFKQYGAGNFDPFDKNSHFIGNWFRGVQVYSDAEDVMPYIGNRVRNEKKRLEERGMPPFTKIRPLRSGDIGVFYQGKLRDIIPQTHIRAQQKKTKRNRRK